MTNAGDGRLTLTVVDATGSTNDDVRLLALDGAPHGTAVAAHVQTAGRGRRGHTWASPRGNLYLSILLRPPVPMGQFVGLSAVCALGVLEALRDDMGVGAAQLKWPNDVLLGERGKLAGVLVEAGSSAQGLYAVCGVGLNVEPLDPKAERAFDSPRALARACLAEALPPGASLDLAEVAEAVGARVLCRVDAWAAAVNRGEALAGPLAPVLDDYTDALPMLGRAVELFDPSGAPLGSGMLAGVDGWGRVTVIDTHGQAVDYSAEQVSLRLPSDNCRHIL